ncbi:MAG: nucleoside triphosphate pyrophosphohydrolase [Ruminococcaceae bacterium]|nr:nucleoside triphosphate pyrophosphohydrolase [Oscillospiraceae bacterium]
MVDNFEFKERYDFYDLVRIMKALRGEGGCPWDAEQTHESIKKDFIEETYEVIEAINKKDPELLCEELGDVLLQVAFHAEIEEEKNVFTIDEVTDGICKKLIERHPHVFGEIKVDGVADVLDNWDTIKRKTKNQKTQAEAMQFVPRELPALMRATKIQSKAKKAGFDWDNIEDVFAKLDEEIAELKEAYASGDKKNVEEELGDVLFTAVNLSRFLDCDAEEVLTASNDKFISRYTKVENLAKERNIDMKNTPLEELDKLWEEIKD